MLGLGTAGLVYNTHSEPSFIRKVATNIAPSDQGMVQKREMMDAAVTGL